MGTDIRPFCTGCKKYADQLEEYIEGAKESEQTITEFVIENEGTYNPSNGHFLCTPCYIDAGMPSNPHPQPNWTAP